MVLALVYVNIPVATVSRQHIPDIDKSLETVEGGNISILVTTIQSNCDATIVLISNRNTHLYFLRAYRTLNAVATVKLNIPVTKWNRHVAYSNSKLAMRKSTIDCGISFLPIPKNPPPFSDSIKLLTFVSTGTNGTIRWAVANCVNT